MAVILYMPDGKKMSDQFLKVLRDAAGDESIETIHAIDKLKVRLQRPLSNVGIVVICVESEENLMDFLYLSDRLGGLRVTLTFPEGRIELLEKARLLRPHLVLTMEEDLKYLAVTLKRMTELFRMIHGQL